MKKRSVAVLLIVVGVLAHDEVAHPAALPRLGDEGMLPSTAGEALGPRQHETPAPGLEKALEADARVKGIVVVADDQIARQRKIQRKLKRAEEVLCRVRADALRRKDPVKLIHR